MRTTLLLLFTFILPYFITAQNWHWARASSGSSLQFSMGTATDATGNVYVTGFFDGGSITFGTTTVTSAGNRDIFLVKYSPCGNVVWARSYGGPNYDAPWAIAADDSGNVFITGYFGSTATFGTHIINSGGANPNVFVAKINSSGTAVWARNSSGSATIPGGSLSDNVGHSIATDAAGSVYITGWFATQSITFSPFTLNNASLSGGLAYEVFVVKYDSAGTVQWAKSAQGSQNDFGNSIATDKAGHVYVTGSHMTTIYFGNDSLVNTTYNSDMFLVQYNAINGSDVWATKGEPDNVNGPTEIGQAVVADVLGNVYVAGQFSCQDLAFGNDTLHNLNTGFTQSYDYFVAKYNSTGIALWARAAGGAAGNENAAGLAVDSTKGVYVAGTFTSTSITIGTNTLLKTGAPDPMFIAEYDAAGNVTCATSLDNGEPDYDNVVSITSDAFGQMYLAGNFKANPFMVGTNSLPLTGTVNSFSAKFTCGPANPLAQLTAGTSSIASSCSAANGSATAIPTGGVFPYTYLWSNTQTTQTITGLAPGSYSVTITDANGCNSSATAIVAGGTPVSVSISGSDSVCFAQTVQLNVSASGGTPPYTYAWNPTNFNPVVNTVYSVTVTDASSCTVTASFSVTIWQVPHNVTANDSTICANDSATICAPLGMNTYHWNTGAVTSCITALLAGNYYVTVTDSHGCTAESSHLPISVFPLPPVSISVNSDTLTAYNAVTYQWYLDGTVISGATDSIYIAQSGGSFTVEVTDSNGCHAVSAPVLITAAASFKEQREVTVYPNPATDKIIIESPFDEYSAEIFSLDGREQLCFKGKHKTASIDIAHLPAGFYFVNVTAAGSRMVRRFAKE